MDVDNIVNQFLPGKIVRKLELYGNGHINDTYKLDLYDSPRAYILQRINTRVFTRPEDLVANHQLLQGGLQNDTENIEIPHLLATVDGKYLLEDKAKQIWRMTNFICDSYSVDVVENSDQAFEAGRGYGWFFNRCSGFEPKRFKEAIKDFHRLAFRNKQLADAIVTDAAGRRETVTDIIDFYSGIGKSLHEMEREIERGEIPVRLVHNDTKINNLLFRNAMVVAVIDLDTVGPGLILYDFGDAIRSIANTAAEDEENLDLVDFDLDFFRSFAKGYLKSVSSILHPAEKKYLHQAPILMSYIMGIRFLTDYLNGDVYYKIKYESHNLQRSLVHKKLIGLMELNAHKMESIINRYGSDAAHKQSAR